MNDCKDCKCPTCGHFNKERVCDHPDHMPTCAEAKSEGVCPVPYCADHLARPVENGVYIQKVADRIDSGHRYEVRVFWERGHGFSHILAIEKDPEKAREIAAAFSQAMAQPREVEGYVL